MANIALITNNILSDSGTAITSVISGSGTTNYLSKFTGSTALGNSIIYDNGTAVGIGTTSPNSLPSGGGGIFSIYQSAAASLWLGGNVLSLDGQGTARDLELYFRWSNSATISTDSYFKFLINNSEKVRIASSGNVLIGSTTDNGAKLQVNGVSSFSGNVVMNGNNFYLGSNFGNTVLRTISSVNVQLFNNNTGATLFLDANGAVQIGQSSAVSWAYFNASGTTIYGTTTLSTLAGTGTRMVVADGSGILSTQAIPGGISGSGTTNYIPKFTGSTSVGNSNIVDNGGNIGIGTTSSISPLEITNTGSGGGGLSMFTSTYSSAKQWGFRQYGIDNGSGIYWASDVQFSSTWYNAIRIGHGQNANNPSFQSYYGTYLATNSGNVLIGTTSDNGYKLQVSGRASIYIGSSVADAVAFTASDGSNGLNYIPYVGTGSYNNLSYGGGSLLFNNISSRLTVGTHNGTAIQFGPTDTIISGNVGIETTSPYGKLSLEADGTVNNYSSVIRVANTGSGKWGGISFVDSQTSTTNANNYYFIGRGASFSDRVLSLHIPTASDYGSGSQPKIGFYSTGADLLFTVEASTGTTYFKGNVLIGTTTNSGYKLDVVGGTARIVYSGYAGIEYHNTAGTWEGYIGTESGSGNLRYNSRQGAHTWYNNSSATMTLTAAGRLGIGTTSPGYKLDVAGETRISTGTTGNIILIEGSSGRYVQFGTDGSGQYIEQVGTSGATRVLRIQNSNGSGTYTQLFLDGANQKIYTSSNVNVIIGTSTDNGEKLQVNGSATIGSSGGSNSITINGGPNGTASYYGSGVGNGSWDSRPNGNAPYINQWHTGLTFSANSYYGGIRFYNQAYPNVYSSVLVMSVTNDNVGIGTTSPSSKLHVDNPGYSFIAGYDAGNRRVYVGLDSVGEPSIQAALSNGVPRQLDINPLGGNVGIGTTNPNGFATTGRTILSLNGASNTLIEFKVGDAFQNYIYSTTSTFELYSSSIIDFQSSGASRLRIASSGNVLIGTTSDGGYKLSVNGSGNFNLGNSGYVRLQSGSGQRHGYIQSAFSNFLFSNNIYYDGSNWRYDQNGYGAQIQTETLSSGVIAFNTFASGTGGNVATIIESMRIVNNGNILMGTTTDSGYKLDVNGTSRFTNSISLTGSNRYIGTNASNLSIYITGGSSYLDGAYFNLTGNTYGASPGAGSAEFVIRTNSDSKFALFGYNGSSWSRYMTLYGPTGNLNIGSGTTDSGYKLRIEGNTYNDGEIISVGNITTNASAYVNANQSGYNLTVYPDITSGPNNLYSGGQVKANIYTSSNLNPVMVVPSTSQVVMAWYPSTTQGVFIDYTIWIYGGANAMRSGTFMVVNDSSGNVQYTDIATPDLNASTALATLAAANNGGVMEVTLSNGSGNVVFINTVTRYIPTMV
jgi:hypothetical protein